MTTAELVTRAKAGDDAAFTELVKQHQNLVLGFAYNRLGDFHRAQDVVQDTIIVAHARLDTLREPEAFSGWLRGIALNCCRRTLRRNKADWISLDQHLELEATGDDQLTQVERFEERDLVRQAIAALPSRLRDVTTLYYLEERSQKDVAAFLGVSISKVNNDLHASRQHMEGSLAIMAKKEIGKERLGDAFAERLGEIVSTTGPLVEAEVRSGGMPGHLDVLSTEDGDEEVLVIQHLGNGRWRGLQTGTGLKSGDRVKEAGSTWASSHRIGEDLVRDVVARQKVEATTRLLETGIKVVDLMAPVTDGSSLGIVGGAGVGRVVFLEELIERRNAIPGQLKTFFFLDGWDAMGAQGMPYEREHVSDVHGTIENTFLLFNKSRSPVFAEEADFMDVRIYFSPLQAMRGNWPAIDPLHCYSVHSKSSILDKRHLDLAEKTRETIRAARQLVLDERFWELLALGARPEAMARYQDRHQAIMGGGDEMARQTLVRADRLEAFLTQPFLVSTAFTGLAGEEVPLAQTLAGVEAILAGQYDGTDVADLRMKGAI